MKKVKNKKKKISHTVECPICGKILICKGIPGEKVSITCPKCKAIGFFKCPDDEEIDGNIEKIEVFSYKFLSVINILFSVPLGSIMIIIGGLFSYFSVFFIGIFILLQSIIICIFVDLFRPIIHSFLKINM